MWIELYSFFGQDEGISPHWASQRRAGEVMSGDAQ